MWLIMGRTMRRLAGLADFFENEKDLDKVLKTFVGGAKHGLYMLIESGNMSSSAQNLRKALA